MGFLHRDSEHSRVRHEGWVIAVLPTGEDAPRDNWEELLEAAQTHELAWAWSLKYDGREGRPLAAGIRAVCRCGWRGLRREANFRSPETADDLAQLDWHHHAEVSLSQVLPSHVAKALNDAERAVVNLTFPRQDLARLDEHRPLAAIRAATYLRARAEQMQKLAVAAARASGHSWEEISRPLRTTRQSAHERFSKS
ncbi:hypothetical protein [Streptomyces sp. NPDC056480]|uniref:hypothetical protein n=1 Tax=Streptomyces sp. NPDC056480 TaxID=3345833 RepID=UPI003687A625